MASATKRGKDRWLARYRGPDGKERSKTFRTKGEALAWAREQERRIRSHDWTDPARGKITIAEWGPRYLETLDVKPKTYHEYKCLIGTAILPRWGDVRLDRISTADVRGWVAHVTGARGQVVSPSRSRQAFVLFRRMLDLAVEDGRLPKNPAKPPSGGRGFLPRLTKTHTHRYLTHGELDALATHAIGYRPLVLVLGYCGLRWGEATGLRVGDVDLMRGRIHVRRAASEIAGRIEYGPPKSHATRAVGVPDLVKEVLGPLLVGKDPEDLLFTAPAGGPLRNSNFRRTLFRPAAKAGGLEGLRIHDLRHTAASLAISSGANVKVVQRMLGHSSAAMTLDTYADLFDTDLDTVAHRLNQAAVAARADSVRTGHAVINLPAELADAG